MDVSNMLLILITGLALAAFCAAFINGVFITTRGATVTGPDGKKRDQDAMIFYPIYKLICKQRAEDEYVCYEGEQLKKLLASIHKAYPPLSSTNYETDPDSIRFQDTDDVLAWEHPMILSWLDNNDVHAKFFEHKIMFFARYPRYILPAIIRKPIVQCVKCMASFWGSLIWWGLLLPLWGWQPAWQVPGWIAFCFTTAYLSTLLYKKAMT